MATPTFLAYVPDDGYTEKGYIIETLRQHPAIRFTYRPMDIGKRVLVQNKSTTTKPEVYNRICAEVVAKYVTSWDVKDAKGEVLPITPENVAKLKPMVHGAFFGIVTGQIASDADPEWTTEEKEEKVDEDFNAAIFGISAEETHRKNS